MAGRRESFLPHDPDATPPRRLRGLVAVPWRHAGPIAACVLVGAAASWGLSPRQAPPPAAATGAVAFADDRDPPQADPSDHGIEAEIAQARANLRQSEDRIATLLVTDGNAFEGALRLDLGPDAGAFGAIVLPPPAGAAAQRAPAQAELDRLERLRRAARERWLALQRRFDQIDLTLQLPPTAAGRRVVPSPWTPGTLLGPAIGLLLGLALAARRELGGDRMRSSRDAERALGLPVLGAIPTLSTRARSAYLGPPPAAPGAPEPA